MSGSEDPRIGAVLGDNRYRVQSRIAAGAMGAVYKAERIGLGRAVAVKFLHSAFMRDPEFTRRFEVEARAMSRVSHPHCVSVIDFGMADVPYLVMDFVHGKTLRELIDAGPLPAARALPIVRQILGGLAHAHGKGIVHRDIKPANIMLTEATGTGDHVRILDFGLAKMLTTDKDAGVTAPMAVGTPSYMSPEQARGDTVDARADIYAVGILLYELLTGDKPFWADEAVVLIRMHIEDPPPSLAAKQPPGVHFSPTLEALVAKALSKSADDRFQSATDMVEAIDNLPEASVRWPPVPSAYEPTSTRTAAPARRKQAVVVAISLLGMSTAAAFALREGASSSKASENRDAQTEGEDDSPTTTVAQAVARPAAPDAGVAGTPSAPSSPKPPPASVAEAQRQLAAGNKDEAYRTLVAVRRDNPRNARANLMLGHLQFDRLYFSDGLDSYDAAIASSSDVRTNNQLLDNVMRAFTNDRTRPGAESLILKRVGRAALTRLDKAAKADKSRAVRVRAAVVAKKLRQRR